MNKKNQMSIVLFILLIVGILLYFFLGTKYFREGLENVDTENVNNEKQKFWKALVEVGNSIPQTWRTAMQNASDAIDKQKLWKAMEPALIEINESLPQHLRSEITDVSDIIRISDMIDASNINNKSLGSNGVQKMNYDNYNHYDKTSSHVTNGTIFYGPAGSTALIVTNSDGSQSLKIIHPNTKDPIIYSTTQPSPIDTITSITYYGPNGSKAKIIKNNDGTLSIHVTTASGTNIYNQYGIYAKNDTLTTYYGSTGNVLPSSTSNTAYTNQITPITPIINPSANTVAYPNSSTSVNVIKPNADYSSVLPAGIPANQIPPGKEDLYILKSQVIPPVCPAPNIINACPKNKNNDNSQSNYGQMSGNNSQTPWGSSTSYSSRYPDYSSTDKKYLPVPVLADFSSFGM